MKGVKGTLWAAFNAVTEYVDHDMPMSVRKGREQIGEQEKRLASAWFGGGASFKAEAFESAYSMATS